VQSGASGSSMGEVGKGGKRYLFSTRQTLDERAPAQFTGSPTSEHEKRGRAR